jgi:Zn-dependent peptidase ImmA (M78 family)/O-acetyl-ADP-ribose deacetylase (regulator of RNase III)
MQNVRAINWTNRSVRAFAKDADPIKAIEDAARKLVLRARENGWEGPPFNPLRIAEMLGVKIEANSGIADARLIATERGPKIEFNPQQPRERVRFSIAHEVAHMLFPDWHERTRNRGRQEASTDEWQLEMLCNLAASEFVLPTGSLPAIAKVPSIEELMRQRREYDVSAEAFLIRLAKISNQPIGVFFASPAVSDESQRRYTINYFTGSPTAPRLHISGMAVPTESVVSSCTAIGYTGRSVENWIIGSPTQVECVGIPAYPGSVYPRVAGLVKFDHAQEDRMPIRVLHGSILEPRNGGHKIICQLVNDKAVSWGGGVARKVADRFPGAEASFKEQILKLPHNERLGTVVFAPANEEITAASLIAQEGYGPSLFPRIRYEALRRCFEAVVERAKQSGASIHMPRLGTGSAGGDWRTIEEMLDDTMVRAGLSVTIYDPPPRRIQLELF